jgi:hypothetical protein
MSSDQYIDASMSRSDAHSTVCQTSKESFGPRQSPTCCKHLCMCFKGSPEFTDHACLLKSRSTPNSLRHVSGVSLLCVSRRLRAPWRLWCSECVAISRGCMPRAGWPTTAEACASAPRNGVTSGRLGKGLTNTWRCIAWCAVIGR